MARSPLLLIALAGFISHSLAFHPKNLRVSNNLVPKLKTGKVLKESIKMSKETFDSVSSFASKFQKLVVPTILAFGLLAAPLDNAFAAQSGGRSGGSSFRSSPSRSSTRLYSSPRTSSTTIIPVPMPMYSPFGYGFGFNPFGFVPINMNLLILGGIAYAVYTILSNRMGGSDFSESENLSSLGSGTTVLKLQVALDADWDRGNIMETLADIAARNGQMSSRSDLAALLSDASLALLRRRRDWNSVAFEGEKLNAFSNKQTEPLYQRMAVKERSKFEVENSSAGTIKGSLRTDIKVPTQAVVSLVVALRGSSEVISKFSRSEAGLAECLQTLAAEALTDEGENVLAVEVLWTPSEPGTVISQRELIEDYPELIRI